MSDWKEFLDKSKNRWNGKYGADQDCPYCYHNAEWLDISCLEEHFLGEVVRLKEEVKVLLMKPSSNEREIDLVEQGKKQGQLSYVKELAGIKEVKK